MLEHLNSDVKKPERVVILGANGFVGGSAKKCLLEKGINVLSLSRQDIDLLSDRAAQRLASLLKPSDSLVMVSAQAPCKTIDMLMNNFRMMQTVCQVLKCQPVNHVLYISSDAVYADSDQPLTEHSVAAPNSLHGVMHMTREMMLRSVLSSTPLVILRPSLLYGAAVESPSPDYLTQNALHVH